VIILGYLIGGLLSLAIVVGATLLDARPGRHRAISDRHGAMRHGLGVHERERAS
jgi:hypothetical protein